MEEIKQNSGTASETGGTPVLEATPLLENEKTVDALQAEITALRKALQTEKDAACVLRLLNENGAKNPVLVGKLLDLTGIARDGDGALSETGLREHITALRAAEGYLFADANAQENETGDGATAPTTPHRQGSGTAYMDGTRAPAYRVPVVRDPSSMSDAEFYRAKLRGEA